MRRPHLFSLMIAIATPITSLSLPAEYNQEDGLHGEIQLLLGGLEARGKDIVAPGNERLTSANAQDLSQRGESFDSGFILPNIELGYLFNQGQNEVFWRSNSEPTSEFRTHSEIGFSHQFYSGINASLIISPAALGNGTTVWQDPFATGNKRKATQAETNGFGIDIDYLLDGSLSLSYRYNDTQVKKERAGQSLNNLTKAQQKQLERDNTSHYLAAELTYMMSPQTYLISDIHYTQQQGKQDSMDASLPGVNLSLYHFNYEREYYAQLVYRNSRYQNNHVVFNKKRNDEDINFTAGIRFHQLIGNKWMLDALVSGGENNSNIGFYDKEYYLLALGVSREF